VIRSHEHRGSISVERSTVARQALLDLPITRYPTLNLIERAWALRHNFTAYDAMYVALAEALAMRLVTADGHLAAATSAHTAVEVVLLQ
jgi:predicted nucleic acid-binding protein